ncbi:MAG TPA: DUF5309 family protein [Limnochordia bacterium]|nr:DUF5309 family protein [Limnochordia bacterium]
MFALYAARVDLRIDIALFADTVIGVNQDQRQFDIDTVIRFVNPLQFPLSTILKKLKKMVASDPKFEWFEHDTNPRTDAINNGSGYNSSATSLVVDNADRFTVNDIVMIVRTQEHVRVTAIDTGTNTLTVVRGYGETAAAAIVDNDDLLILGGAYGENAGAANQNLINPTTQYNLLEITRTAWSTSGSAMQTSFYTGDQRQNRRREKLKEHMVDIERKLLFGERKAASGTAPATTRGLLKYITTNVYAAGGTLTQSEFDQSFLEPAMQYSSDAPAYGDAQKWLFCSPRLLSVLAGFAQTSVRIAPKDSAFGVAYRQYVSPHGVINLVGHPLLTTATVNGYGFLLDLGSVEYRYLKGRDVLYRPNIVQDGTDGVTDEYLTECGLKLANEQQHGVITGVTG